MILHDIVIHDDDGDDDDDDDEEDGAMMQIVHRGWVGPLEASTGADRNY